MTRTSKALKRLGVAGLAVVTIGAGVPALIGTAAQAATAGPATSISVTPSSQSAGTGTCQVFTVKVADTAGMAATGTVTVQIQDPSALTDTADPNATSAQFCSVTTGNEPAAVSSTPGTPRGQRYITFQATNGTATFGVNDIQAETVGVTTFLDQNGDGVFNPTQDTAANAASATFTAGNTSYTGAATQTANDNVKNMTDKSLAGASNITVLLTNAAGDVVTGATPTLQYKAGSVNGGATATSAGAPITNACTASNNSGLSTCTVTQPNGGTDTIVVYVNQSPPTGQTPGPDANEPQITVTRVAPSPASAATSVSLTPNGQTFAPGSSVRYTATVSDKNGNPVLGISVAFSSSGAGGTQTGSSTTDASGHATFITYTASNDTGTQKVTATVTGSTACTTTTPCSATATNTFSNAASPSPSSSTTPPASRQALSLVVNTPVINAGTQGKMTVTGAANEAIQLVCYTRPSTTYKVARNATIDAAGSPITFTLSLGMNTRCFAQYATNSTQGASASNVINVKTVVSIFPVRNGVRDYTFQGHNLPKYAGQLITLYYESSAGTVRKGYVKTDSSGIYYIPVKFVGTGTFKFFVRTGQTLTNAAGESAHVSVTIH